MTDWGHLEKANANEKGSDDEAGIREVRPFYWLLILVLVILYAWSVASSPELKIPWRLAAFTALILVHAGLHWFSPYLVSRKPRLLLLYFVVQGGLIFCINLLGSSQGMTVGLYLAMAGEAAGMVEGLAPAALAVAGFLLLSIVSFGLTSGWNGLLAWLLWATPMAFFVLVYVVLFKRQATARERAQALLEELEVAHRQLAEYAGRVEALTLAAERQRLARELHDTLAQGLAGLILQLEAASSHLEEGRAGRAQEILRQAMGRARATLGEARQAIGDLRSESPAVEDLSQALGEATRRFTEATGIPCNLKTDLPFQLRDSLAGQALRAVTEGLANVARHARASRAEVRLSVENGELEVIVRDDGAGFNLALAAGQAGHYGLLGLSERARLAGGSLEVASAPGAGTTLRLKLPLREARADG